MKILVLISCFFLGFQSANAQNSKLSAVVADSLSGSPLPFVSVSLFDTKNEVVDGMMTDSVGFFQFSRLHGGTYFLVLKSIGYPQRRVEVSVPDQNSLSLGTLYIAGNSQSLLQVTVNAARPNQMHQGDRQTYLASQYKNAVGGTALDIVKNLPSASLDPSGGLSLRGNTGILVLVNGKPSLVDPATVLSQISANDVLEVEYITHPTAQFDPDGKGGIINIKTKNSAAAGFAWILNLQGGLPSVDDYDNREKQKRYGGDVSFQYRKKSLELNGSAHYLRNDNAGFRDGDVYTIVGDKQTFFPSQGERSFDKYSFGLRLNGAYQMGDKQVLTLGLLASRKFQDRVADIYYQNRTLIPSTGEVLGNHTYFNPNLQNKQGEFYMLDVSYQHKLNSRHSVQTGVIYEHANIYGSTRNRNIKNVVDTVQYTLNRYANPLNGLRFSFQHTWRDNRNELISGYQVRSDKQKGSFEYLATENQTHGLVPVPEFSGKLNAENQVHALFTQYNTKTVKTQFSLGLRYEYYQRHIEMLSSGESFPYTVHQLYPTLTLMQEIGAGWSWKVGAGRRVQRTNNFELNPIPEREHSETLEQGDPNLLPEFITNAEAGLVKTLKRGSLFLNAYYQHTQNPIQRVNSVYADTILYRVFTNANAASRYGLEFGGESKPFSWLKANVGVNIYRYKIFGQVLSYEENREASQWVYALNGGLQARLSSSWNTGIQINYQSDRPTVQGVDARFLAPHFNLSKTFLNGALTAQVQWQFIELGKWGVNEQRITTYSSDFYTTTNYVYEKNILLLNLNFNLYKLNQLVNLPKSEFGEKEF